MAQPIILSDEEHQIPFTTPLQSLSKKPRTGPRDPYPHKFWPLMMIRPLKNWVPPPHSPPRRHSSPRLRCPTSLSSNAPWPLRLIPNLGVAIMWMIDLIDKRIISTSGKTLEATNVNYTTKE
ncbi:uncharacterized protein LOC123229971 [Mangifera indica]|uniref:uncharacterized protein LOC123229639 n=1 Tax=Mangifera indica TaxID=29780 RepID=UPI001CF94A9E|nr:uncharacterized protein LOC123229639 [Mangifera indica]XP_044511976.1 uncharacterized protein LOC123229971 [Mangifera indica]